MMVVVVALLLVEIVVATVAVDISAMVATQLVPVLADCQDR